LSFGIGKCLQQIGGEYKLLEEQVDLPINTFTVSISLSAKLQQMYKTFTPATITTDTDNSFPGKLPDI